MTAEQFELATLLADLKSGNPGAMPALYERFAPPLWRVCAVRLGEVDAAHDVVQDIFVQVWQHMRTFEYRGEAAFHKWLYTIANNAVLTYLRKRQRQPSISLAADGDWPQLHGPDLAHTVCDRLALRQALARLSPAQYQVITLRYFAGLSNDELALVLDRPEGAIRSLHHRALQRLHQLLSVNAEPRRRTRGVLVAA